MLVKLIDVRPAEFDASNQFLGNHRSHRTHTCMHMWNMHAHSRTCLSTPSRFRAPCRIKIRTCRVESRVRGKCIRPILAARKPLFLARLCNPINVQKPRRRYECGEWRRGGLGFRGFIDLATFVPAGLICLCLQHGLARFAPLLSFPFPTAFPIFTSAVIFHLCIRSVFRYLG
jgi:hypothetical protein